MELLDQTATLKLVKVIRSPCLSFDRKRQRFTSAPPAEPAKPTERGKLQAALRAMWEKTAPAQDDGEVES
jgi:hypothetical protein